MRWSRLVVKGVAIVGVAMFCLQVLYLFRHVGYSWTKWKSSAVNHRQKHTELCSSAEDVQQRFGPLTNQNMERLRRIQATCRLAQQGRVDRMTSDPVTRTTYCVVPKTSCTFWLSLFRHLWNDSSGMDHTQHHHPLWVPRSKIHDKSLKNLNFQSLKPAQRLTEEMADTFRFLFVRDPYSRLWSAFIDKLFLLDFWWTEGRKIKAFHESQQTSDTQKERPRRFSMCCSDITFAEFVTYVAHTGDGAPQDLNEHWRPVEYLCNPCQFCPHLVGHVESFAEDSLPVLEWLNLTWILKDYNHVIHQLTMLSDENFQKLENVEVKLDSAPFYFSCTNSTDVARRLWRTFQMYGYIPESAVFPELELGRNITAERFKDVVFQTYRQIPEDLRTSLSRQRQRAMEDAYRSVPMEVMEKLSSIYLYDFVAFAYDMRPYTLFEKRYQLSG